MGLVKNVTSIDKVATQKVSLKMDYNQLNDPDHVKSSKMNDHEQICRICARSKSKTNISYVNVGQIENLTEKLLKYLNIHVTREDPLPKSICIKCFRMLNLVHEFVLMSKESQKASACQYKCNSIPYF